MNTKLEEAKLSFSTLPCSMLPAGLINLGSHYSIDDRFAQ